MLKYFCKFHRLIVIESQNISVNTALHTVILQVLGDIFESLAGAIYLDAGNDLQVVWNVFYKLMWKEIELFSKHVPKDSVRKIFEMPHLRPEFQ